MNDMTEPTLADLFAEGETNVLEWEGGVVHGLFELDTVPDRLTVELLRAKEAPAQGLHVSMTGGALEVNGVRAADVVLWHDTAPPVVQIDVRPRGRTQKLQVWNVWRGPHDATMAWLGNAAMQVERTNPDGVLLRCSDGIGAPAFDDLEVRVRWFG